MMQEDQVSRTDSVSSKPAVDRGRREALVRLGTYSALATPAMMALLTEKSAAGAWNGSGGGHGGSHGGSHGGRGGRGKGGGGRRGKGGRGNGGGGGRGRN